MEYEEESDFPGSVPEFGSIFMSNAATKKECLQLRLLGLPSGQANFVRCVKAGMILFLFEFEKRELYGVYRACSDGAMNIVPRAFSSSGKQFPAQVRFTVIWNCDPLSEHEFRDAIIENYYSNNKFNFGLSKDQVRRLLYLFSSRKLEKRVPRRKFDGQTDLIREEERLSGQKKFISRNRGEKLTEKYNPNFPDDERFRENLEYDRMGEDKGTALGGIKRVVDDGMNLMEAKINFDYNVPQNLKDSLYSSTKRSKDNQFLHYDTIDIESTGDFLARARSDSNDGRFQVSDIKKEKHISSDDGFRLFKPVESFGIPQNKFRRPIHDQSLQLDPKIDYDDGQLYINDRIKIENAVKPSDQMLLNSSRVDNPYTIGNNVGPPLSKNYMDLYQSRQQSSFNSSKPMLEARYSLNKNQHIFRGSTEQNIYGMSYPTSSAMEKNKYEVSFDREFQPDINGSSCSVQDFVPHHSHNKNKSPASNKASLYLTTAENFSPYSSSALGCVSEAPLRGNEDLYNNPHRIMSKSLLREEYCGKIEHPLISHEIYENPFLFSGSLIYKKRKISPFVELDEHFVVSQGKFNHEFQENVIDPAYSGVSFEKNNVYGISSYKYADDLDLMPSNSKKRRAGVFSTSSEERMQGNENYMEYDEIETSVDQVMESLFESLNDNITDAANYSPSVKRHDTDRSLEIKRRDMRYDQKEVDEPKMMNRRTIIKCTQVGKNEENEEDMPKETRVMDFKRRSETKRSRDGENTKGSIQKAKRKMEGNGGRERGGEIDGKWIKRRKLVRPSFGEKEALNDNSKGDKSDPQLLLTHQSSNNNKFVDGLS